MAVGAADGGDACPVGHGVGKVQQDGEKVIKVAGISWEDASKVKGIVDVGDDKKNVCLVVCCSKKKIPKKYQKRDVFCN